MARGDRRPTLETVAARDGLDVRDLEAALVRLTLRAGRSAGDGTMDKRKARR